MPAPLLALCFFCQVSDQTPELQKQIDAAAGGGLKLVLLPAGRFECLGLRIEAKHRGLILRGQGMGLTILENSRANVGDAKGVIQIGTESASARAVQIAIEDLTVRQAPFTNQVSNCLYVRWCDGFALRRVEIDRCAYEGLQTGNAEACRMVLVEDCKVSRCGLGGPAYPRTTAGLNVNAGFAMVRRCEVRDCGQCVECGGHFCQFLDCDFYPVTGVEEGSMGVNIGSTGCGVDGVSVVGCRFHGLGQAMQTANGRGTLANIAFVGNEVREGKVYFSGGLASNTVAATVSPTPARHGKSVIARNRFFFDREQRNGTAIGYSANGAAPTTMGMEPLLIERNLFAGSARNFPALQLSGWIGGERGGEAKVRVVDNALLLPRSDLHRADVLVYDYYGAAAKALEFSGNEQPLVIRRYGSNQFMEVR